MANYRINDDLEQKAIDLPDSDMDSSDEEDDGGDEEEGSSSDEDQNEEFKIEKEKLRNKKR